MDTELNKMHTNHKTSIDNSTKARIDRQRHKMRRNNNLRSRHSSNDPKNFNYSELDNKRAHLIAFDNLFNKQDMLSLNQTNEPKSPEISATNLPKIPRIK